MSGRTLVRGGWVLTLDPAARNHARADVLIEGDLVAEVGSGLSARDAEVIDATDAIVMPGFVDAHRHAWRSLFRNADATAGTAQRELGQHHGPDEVYMATLVGLMAAAEAGITTVVDWFDLPAGDGRLEAALRAHADSGLRTVLVPGAVEASEVATVARSVSEHAGPSTTVAYGSAEPDGANADHLAAGWAAARNAGLRIHAHTGSDAAMAGTVADLAHRGLLDRDVTLVHCSHLGDADLEAVASSGAAVVLTPFQDMAGRMVAPPIQGLVDRGIRPGLGADDEHGAGDAFAQMRATISLQHATLFDLKLAGKAGVPDLMTTREVIRHATLDGARAAGLDAVTGSLRPGAQADLVVLRADRPNIFPINDPIGAVVWGMDTSNVDWVLVAGRTLLREGRLPGDLDDLRERALAARDRVLVSAGGRIETGGTA